MNKDRLPPIPKKQWSAEQWRYAQEIINGPRGALIAPFVPLMRSPELMSLSQKMGEYLRYRSALPSKFSEFAILITAQQWSQEIEWQIHLPIAIQAGISEDIVNSLSSNVYPSNMNEGEKLVYEFCRQLHFEKKVNDKIWNQAIEHFGEQGVIDLIGIIGYYSFLAMLMNAAQTGK